MHVLISFSPLLWLLGCNINHVLHDLYPIIFLNITLLKFLIFTDELRIAGPNGN